MRKINTLITVALLICAGAHAQNFALGARAGLSIPNLTAGGNENPLNTGYSSRQGPDAGITGEYTFSKLFSIEAMIQYSSQGGKKDGFQALTTPSALAAMFPQGAPAYMYANYNSEAKFNYLMIPILAKFGWNFGASPWRIYVDAGPFFGFLLSGKQVTSGQSELYLDAAGQEPLAAAGSQSFNNTDDIKSQLNAFNFGIEGNVGIAYRFGHNSVYIEGGGNYGFLNIQKYSQDGTNNTGAATVDLGYSYWFHKHAPKPESK